MMRVKLRAIETWAAEPAPKDKPRLCKVNGCKRPALYFRRRGEVVADKQHDMCLQHERARLDRTQARRATK